MASVMKDNRPGRSGWRIRFYVQKHRRELYFTGRKRDADELGRKCESLSKCVEAGLPLDADLSIWVKRLDSQVRDTLVGWGLCEPASPKLSTDEGRFLGAFLRGYIDGRKDIRENTKENLEQARRVLIEYFGERHSLRKLTPGDAIRWQRWLDSEKKFAVATISAHTRKVKSMFRVAVDDGLIDSNPFGSLKGFKESNVDRQRYIPHDVIRRILDECPGPQWRLIVTLCRYAGLRCPSEVLALKWTDIDWERGRMRVDSSKTGVRFVPMFPEVRKALDEAYDAAAEGSVRCVDEYHANVANLRTQFGRILKRAGVEAWPRIFHNLRASRRTELQEFLPDHAINKWMGQSSRVAEQHYITLHDEHWDRALKLPSQCPPTRPPIPVKTGPIDAHHGIDETNEMIGVGGMVMDKKHPRQDSNTTQNPQGKRGDLKNCPPPVPPSRSAIPSDAMELLALWPALDDDGKAQVLRLARELAQRSEVR